MLDIEKALELPDISIPNGDIRSLRQQTSVMIDCHLSLVQLLKDTLLLVDKKKLHVLQKQWALHMQKIVGVQSS